MFVLDPRLQQDTIDFGHFSLSRLLLMNDCRYPWFILVPQRESLQEIHQLTGADRQQLWDESARLSLWMERYFDADKLNIAALGNIVSQLHLHHVGRRIDDPAWPNPIWGHSPAIPYSPEEIESLYREVQTEFIDLLNKSESLT